MLESLKGEDCTLIFYEAPHRILDAIEDVGAVMGARQIVIARELTKIHEEFLRGTATEVHAKLSDRAVVRGEITILIGKQMAAEVVDDTPIEEAVRALEAQGVPRMDAIKRIAKERGIPKREVYKRIT